MYTSHIEFANGYMSALTLYLNGDVWMCFKNVHVGSSLPNNISYRKPTVVSWHHIMVLFPDVLSISGAKIQGLTFTK